MFYGSIKSDGTINNDAAFSNNFTVHGGEDDGGKGKYFITFNECLHYLPSITATAISNNTHSGNAVNAEVYMTETTVGKPFQAQITTSAASDAADDHGFIFRARTGQSLTFDAKLNPTLSLHPSIKSFTYDKPDGHQVTNPVLTVKTSIAGLDSTTAQPSGSGTYTVHFDKGTVLLGVLQDGGSLKLEIPTTVKDDDGHKWNLTGWTFGGGAGEQGRQWTVSGDTASDTLELRSAGGGAPVPPMTAPQSFVIMATYGDQTLTTDPIVRLSSVPPGGISL